jgi:hypothetical protein
VTIQTGRTLIQKESMKAVPLAEPQFGVLRTIHPDKFAAVYVNDKFYGHADEFNNRTQGLKLKPGEYGVKIVPVSGGTMTEEKVKIEADKTVILRAK